MWFSFRGKFWENTINFPSVYSFGSASWSVTELERARGWSAAAGEEKGFYVKGEWISIQRNCSARMLCRGKQLFCSNPSGSKPRFWSELTLQDICAAGYLLPVRRFVQCIWEWSCNTVLKLKFIPRVCGPLDIYQLACKQINCPCKGLPCDLYRE